MFKNYIKIGIRNLLKNKLYSSINVFGLAIGMAVFLLITIYTSFELSYNDFHEKSEQIYKISIDDDFSTCAPMAPLFKERLPELNKIVRVDENYGGGSSPVFIINEKDENKKIKMKEVLFVDEDFFEIFSFEIIHGDAKTSLKDPNSIILTKSSSLKIFGYENSVGKRIHYVGARNGKPELDMIVSAIVEDPPANSTISFSALGSFSAIYSISPEADNDWRNWGYMTYVLLNKNGEEEFQKRLSEVWKIKNEELWPGDKVSEIGIVSLLNVPFYKNNRELMIYFLQLIGVFVLFIAIINFVNITIAKSTTRAKEIGIRKVVGSVRFELIKQFLLESVIVSLLVAPIAILIVLLMKYPFYNIINKEIPFTLVQNPVMYIILLLGVILLGVIAGLYPAFYLSSFSPALIMKGEITKGKKKNTLRFSLFVFQFVISACLVISTLLITKQIEHLKTKPLGFDNKNIIHARQSKEINDKYDVFKEKLLQNPNVISVARSNHELGKSLNIGANHEINGVKKSYSATTVDPDFIPTMKIEILEGRGFSWDIPSDEYSSIIINETFVKEFDLKNPIDMQIDLFSYKANIIGVMKDFHYDSFHEVIKPSALLYANWNGRINIRLSESNISKTIEEIEIIWNEISPITTFEYEFLDETYNSLYKSEEELQKLIASFSFVAILIACLGLFGLVSYSTERRAKEIGIRKVLGSPVSSIIVVLAKEYVRWVIIANIIAWPIAYFLIINWLESFPYRISVTPLPFILAGSVALFIAVATISFQILKSAMVNPVDSLRSE